MCLILLAWQRHPDFALVVAANRDEFHARPAEPAAFWKDHPGILAGRDLEAGGTWMGVSRTGRFAAVTNYRGGRDPAARASRGALVSGFLSGTSNSKSFIAGIQDSAGSYSGFNLLVCDGQELWWLSNRDGGSRRLGPGIYGLGNLLLDTPEVEGAKADFSNSLAFPSVERLFRVLERSRILSPDYGTRCSTVLMMNGASLSYAERPFLPDGREGATARFEVPAA
jgi:uncharacterized protein with NRDE domain